ncbi:DUF4189 domain-containing protein [Pseudomonas sp. nanlin1]|uniref:DUF4189 domain-containing protein n=1 Tax=Pseudomonas sp. nanlin1 TaxID=3040605 RepID=UPI00388EBB5B
MNRRYRCAAYLTFLRTGHVMRRTHLCWLLALLASHSAVGQTACPAGVAPGSPQCGPDSGTSRGEPPAPRYTGEWIKTWGALAKNAGGDVGFAMGKYSKKEAESEAVQRCESFDSGSCKVFEVIYNQCVAAATPPSGATGVAVAGSKERASELAKETCEKTSGQSCRTILAECSKPVFEKF